MQAHEGSDTQSLGMAAQKWITHPSGPAWAMLSTHTEPASQPTEPH